MASTFPIPTTSGPLVPTINGFFLGYNIHETAGAAAKVYIYSGPQAAGVLLAVVALTANQSVDIAFPWDLRLNFQNGLYFSITGSVEGVIKWVK